MNSSHEEPSRLDSLREAYDRDPNDIEHATELAQYYADRGWYNQAVDIYKKLLQTNADNYALLLDYGNVCFRRDDLDEASSVFTTLTVIRPRRVEGWNNLGITNMRLGDFEQARVAFEHVLEIEPDNPGALLNMGNYSQEKEAFEEAEAYFRKAVSARLDFADAWFNLGNLLLRKGSLEEAVETFKKALRYYPEFGSAYKNLGVAQEALGRHSEALENYKSALDYNRADPGVYINIGNVYLAMGNAEQAKQHYLSAVKLAPRNIGGWMGLRHLALSKGDVESYVKATLAVVQRLHPDVIAESVRTVRRLHHLDKASNILHLADELDKKSESLDAERLVVYSQKKPDSPAAEKLKCRLEQLDEPPADVLLCLAEYYEHADEPQTAIEYASRPEIDHRIEAKRVLWNSLIKQGSLNRVEASVSATAREHPEYADCSYYLARVSAARGDTDAARDHLLKALENGYSDMAAIDEEPVLSKIRSESVADHMSRNWEAYRSKPHSPSS